MRAIPIVPVRTIAVGAEYSDFTVSIAAQNSSVECGPTTGVSHVFSAATTNVVERKKFDNVLCAALTHQNAPCSEMCNMFHRAPAISATIEVLSLLNCYLVLVSIAFVACSF
jgi:hypothetical protein